jgi:hypothetical protein
MKTTISLFSIILFIFILNVNSVSAVADSCLTLYCPNDGVNYNPDLIMIDTCKDSPTYGDWYLKGALIMSMKEYVFSKLIPEAHSAYVEDIDTVKYLNLRDSFLIIEKRYGRIQFFRDPYECSNQRDDEFLSSPCLDIRFPKYNRLEDVNSDLGSLSISRRTMLKISCQAMTEVNEVKNNSLYLLPNPCYDKLKIINIDNQVSNSTKIEIYSSFGQRTGFYEFSNELNEIEIDVSHLSSGIYLIKINNSSLKFIKLE